MLLQRNKRKHATYLLFLIYLGYFAVVSLFVHMHVYEGVIYVHSHPYRKSQDIPNNSNKLPLETHQHTAASFFTLSQVSNITSGEAQSFNFTGLILSSNDISHKEYKVSPASTTPVRRYRLRAPPLV